MLTRCIDVCRGPLISHQLLGFEVFACETQHLVEHGFHFIQFVSWIRLISEKRLSNGNFIDLCGERKSGSANVTRIS